MWLWFGEECGLGFLLPYVYDSRLDALKGHYFFLSAKHQRYLTGRELSESAKINYTKELMND